METTVKPGMRFEAKQAVAPTQPTPRTYVWHVIEATDDGNWRCVRLDIDQVADEAVFATQDVLEGNAQYMHEASPRRIAGHAFAMLDEGEIVHYHDGHGKFVRCTVAKDVDENGIPCTVLKPTALVGRWGQDEIISRDRYGEERVGHHARRILTGNETFRPHPSNIYEVVPFTKPEANIHRYDNPALGGEAPLSLPPMSEDEKRQADKWRQVREIREATERGSDPDQIIQQVRESVVRPFL